MDITLVVTLIGAIEQLLALFGPAIPSGAIGNVIAMLQKILPLIGNGLPTVYQSIKNIITAVQSSDDITPEQIKELQAIDAKVDADFEAAASAVDPDKV